jgi:hypothetical protein
MFTPAIRATVWLLYKKDCLGFSPEQAPIAPPLNFLEGGEL